MKIKSFGPKKHPLTSYWPENSDFKGGLSRSGLAFFNNRLIGIEANHAVVAYGLDDHIIGYFRFSMTPKSRRLHACGTWVDPKYRGKNIAADIWIFAIRKFQPRSVRVLTVSRGGDNLVRSLIAKDVYKTIKWFHETA